MQNQQPEEIIIQHQETPARKSSRRKMSQMERLETQSQPYIVYLMAIVAVIRGFYLFTDKMVNLSHYPAINYPLSIITGLALSLVSEITVSIAGRRRKNYVNKLYHAEMSLNDSSKRDKEKWATQIRYLRGQKRDNTTALYVSMIMSLIAAASYLIDSTNAQSVISMLIASAIAGYVLFLMYFHGVQTDEIKPDSNEEVQYQLDEQWDTLAIEQVHRLRQDLATQNIPILTRLRIIASRLSVERRRQYISDLKRLFEKDNTDPEDDEDNTSSWWSMKELAIRAGEDFATRKLDYITRKYRRKVSDIAESFPESTKFDSKRGWRIEPTFAAKYFNLPSALALEAGKEVIVESEVVEVQQDEE